MLKLQGWIQGQFLHVYLLLSLFQRNNFASVYHALKPLKAGFQNEGNVPVRGAKQEKALFSLVAIPQVTMNGKDYGNKKKKH